MSDQTEMLMFLDEAESYILGIPDGEDASRAAQVAEKLRDLVRKHVRPTVGEVLPLALAYHRRYPEAMRRFFHERRVYDASIREDHYAATIENFDGVCEAEDDDYGIKFLELLLEMSPTGRRKVARRARSAVACEGLRSFGEVHDQIAHITTKLANSPGGVQIHPESLVCSLPADAIAYSPSIVARMDVWA